LQNNALIGSAKSNSWFLGKLLIRMLPSGLAVRMAGPF
jgi:hypothetical protein